MILTKNWFNYTATYDKEYCIVEAIFMSLRIFLYKNVYFAVLNLYQNTITIAVEQVL